MGVVVGDVVGVDGGAGGGEDALGVVDVLDGDGDAVEGAAGLAGLELALAAAGVLEGGRRVEGDPDAQVGFEGVGAGEQRLHERDGGEGAVGDEGRGLGDGEFVEVGHGCTSVI